MPLVIEGAMFQPWDIASSLVVLMLVPLGIGLFVRALAAAVVVGGPSGATMSRARRSRSCSWRGEDLAGAMASMVHGDDSFNQQFREFVKDVHGVDLAAGGAPDVTPIVDNSF